MLGDAADGLSGVGAGRWRGGFVGEVAGLDEGGDDGSGHVGRGMADGADGADVVCG